MTKCVICGRTRQGANVCYPCRCAVIRLLDNGFSVEEMFLVMMFAKHRKSFSHWSEKVEIEEVIFRLDTGQILLDKWLY